MRIGLFLNLTIHAVHPHSSSNMWPSPYSNGHLSKPFVVPHFNTTLAILGHTLGIEIIAFPIKKSAQF